jgi:hypothetical protein
VARRFFGGSTFGTELQCPIIANIPLVRFSDNTSTETCLLSESLLVRLGPAPFHSMQSRPSGELEDERWFLRAVSDFGNVSGFDEKSESY